MICHPFSATPHRPFITVLSVNPLLDVTCHNQQRAEATDLRQTAPYNYLERFAGPFLDEDRAVHFSKELVKGTRGKPSLCKRIVVLAAKYGVPCYGQDVPLPGGETNSAFLARRGAPPEYVEAVKRLEEAGAVLDTEF